MNKFDLLKKLLPGFLPILVFIIADAAWGPKIGMYVAVGFGLIQFIYILLKEKRVDKFVLFDTALIVALGLISILLENEIFFKLKPALIGFIICILMAFSVFSKYNIILLMGKRYMGDIESNNMQIKALKQNIIIFFYIFLSHSLLVLYSAFYMSNEAWAFISGFLLYIIFGIYFIIQLAYNKYFKKKDTEEWFPIVDSVGKVIGRATRTACHSDNSLLHPVVHLHVFNSKGEIYLQKRPDWKDIQPNKWDTAVGGHVQLNEKIEDALIREANEELNLNDFKPNFIKKYIWKSDIESELVFSFFSIIDCEISINKSELNDGRFWTIKEIIENIKHEIFTPNFLNEFETIKKIIK